MLHRSICYALALVVSLMALGAAHHAEAQPKKPKAPTGYHPGVHYKDFAKLEFGADVKSAAKVVKARYTAVKKAQLVVSKDAAEKDTILKKIAADTQAFLDTALAFTGQNSGYEVSLISGLFCHKAGQTMYTLTDGLAKYYFLYSDGKLFRLVYTAPAETTYEEFVKGFVATYGPPVGQEPADQAPVKEETKGKKAAKGKKAKEEPPKAPPLVIKTPMVWKSDDFTLKVRDESKIYKTFVIIWTYEPEAKAALAKCGGGTTGGVGGSTADDLLNDITKPGADDEGVVDDIIGGTPAPLPGMEGQDDDEE